MRILELQGSKGLRSQPEKGTTGFVNQTASCYTLCYGTSNQVAC